MASVMRKIGSSRRVLAVALAVMMSTSLLPIAASAQDGIVSKTQTPSGQPANQDQSSITRPIAQTPDVPNIRVGVTPGQNAPLSMQDAIAMALKNNLDIESFRQGVQIAERNLYSLRGVYDVLTGSDVNYRSQTTPVANLFAGGGSQGSFTQEGVTFNFSADQFIEKGGGAWSIDFTNNRLVTDSTASTLPTQFNTGLNFTFSQPLMRNFSIDSNRRLIQVAKKTLDLTDSQFRQMVIETINNVQ